jgi:hypothetical protein
VPLLGSITAQSGQSTDTTIEAASGESSTKILIDQETFAAIRIKDVDQLQSDINKIQSYSGEMARTIKQKGVTLNLASYMADNCASGNKLQFTGLVSGATTITYAGLLALHEKLNVADIPMEDRYLVVTPKHLTALWNVVDGNGSYIFVNKDYDASSNSFEKGVIAKGLGFSVVVTTNMPKLTTAGAVSGSGTQFCILCFQKSAIAACVQKGVEFKSAYNTTKRAEDIVGTTIWGRKVIRDTGIICVRDNT